MVGMRSDSAKLILCCAMTLFVSGYALQTLSFSMPGLVRDWRLASNWAGPLLSVAIFGLLLGYLFVAPLADRVGERVVICGALLGLSAATLLCLAASGVALLAFGRLMTGMAVGAAVPGAVSIASRHGRRRWRGAQIIGIYLAFSSGFLVAGLMSGWLVPLWGWRAPWGFSVPVALISAALLWKMLPPGAPIRPVARPLPILFAPRLRVGTLLFWLIFSIGLGLFYALQAWLPLLSAREGQSYGSGVAATSFFTLGTAFGAVPAVWWSDRLGPFRALLALGGMGFAGVLLLGCFAARGGFPFHAAAFLSGIGIGGGQKGMIAAAALFYPPSVRSTGLGWALGIGRLGAAGGPLLVGYLVMIGMASGTVLLCLSLPAPLLLFSCALLDRIYGRIDRAHFHPVDSEMI